VAGYFQFVDLSPGEYVIIVGTSAETGVVIEGEDSEPFIFEVLSGEVTDVGEKFVVLDSPPALSPLNSDSESGYPPPPTPAPYP